MTLDKLTHIDTTISAEQAELLGLLRDLKQAASNMRCKVEALSVLLELAHPVRVAA
jgi:hypothetical protein